MKNRANYDKSDVWRENFRKAGSCPLWGKWMAMILQQLKNFVLWTANQ